MTTESASSAALEERVSGLERLVASVANSVDRLAIEVRDRQKFPWGAATFALGVIALLAAVVTFGFMAYIGAIAGSQDRLQAQLSSWIDNSVSRSELEERRESTSSRMERIETDIDQIDSGIVPRGEHEEHWRSQAEQVANLQRQIDVIRSEFGSSYSLNDAMTSLQDRLDRLESLRLQSSPTAPVPGR
jgi:predicted Abi (CAAX) family protease